MVGLIQALYEGAMYTFVFMWTPTITEHTVGFVPPFGLIFATFMVAVMLGSYLFSSAMAGGIPLQQTGAFAGVPTPPIFFFFWGVCCSGCLGWNAQLIGPFPIVSSAGTGLGLLVAAAIALSTPIFNTSTVANFGAFLVFEATCGMYWPVFGMLRSRLIPEGRPRCGSGPVLPNVGSHPPSLPFPPPGLHPPSPVPFDAMCTRRRRPALGGDEHVPHPAERGCGCGPYTSWDAVHARRLHSLQRLPLRCRGAPSCACPGACRAAASCQVRTLRIPSLVWCAICGCSVEQPPYLLPVNFSPLFNLSNWRPFVTSAAAPTRTARRTCDMRPPARGLGPVPCWNDGGDRPTCMTVRDCLPHRVPTCSHPRERGRAGGRNKAERCCGGGKMLNWCISTWGAGDHQGPNRVSDGLQRLVG